MEFFMWTSLALSAILTFVLGVIFGVNYVMKHIQSKSSSAKKPSIQKLPVEKPLPSPSTTIPPTYRLTTVYPTPIDDWLENSQRMLHRQSHHLQCRSVNSRALSITNSNQTV
ncbi:hypothetical protein F5Y03DRAFT_319533 [Xylaria venustula]|nr:hypothetical protein F5Y03DRAFT_319533 [Xylaria venustula]